jgi:WS/DGAT/MGAT family acyltransferase
MPRRRGTGGPGGRLSDADSILWTLDRDPVLRSVITAVILLDRAVPVDEVVKRIDGLCRASSHFRSCVHTAPTPWGRPVWRRAEHFDPASHLLHLRAPEPADLRTLLDLAQHLALPAFDPARPLWEAMLVDGLADGRAALIVKVHHSVVDGVGGIQVAARLLDGDRRGSPLLGPPPPSADHGGGDGGPRPFDRASRALRWTASVTGRLGTVGVAAVRRPGRSLRQGLTLLDDTRRLVEPTPTPLSPIMRGRGMERRFDLLPLDRGLLPRLTAAGGLTLNDAFVAGLLRGLSTYHHRHGARAERLRMVMPVSTRRPGDPVESNHFTPARFVLPADLPDARAYLDQIPDHLRRWKHSPSLAVSDTLAAGLDRLPGAVTVGAFALMLKGVDLVATNVPGPPTETYLAGARVEAIHAFAPPAGAAVNAALVTTAGRPSIGITTDTVAVPDPGTLAECIAEAFEELADAADEYQRRRGHP